MPDPNPGGFIDVSLGAKKSNASASYWYQAFTTTVDNPSTATLDLDWIVSAINPTFLTSMHVYAFIDTTSANPTVGQEVWDSGNMTGTTSWASISQVDISSKLPTAGTYYVKIGVYAVYNGTNSPTGVQVGFDNVQASWSSAGTPTYDTSRPAIYPNASLTMDKTVSWNGFTETATKNGGEIYYQLSDDNGAIWQYWNGSAWVTAGVTDYSIASVVDTNIPTFSITNNQIIWRAFLSSDGTQQVILDNVAIDYTENTLPVIANVSPEQGTSTGYVYINYDLQDGESDPLTLTDYEYSLTGAFAGEEVTMSAVAGDPQYDGVSSLASSPSGITNTFVWDAQSQIGSIYDATVYVRLRSHDGVGYSDYTASSAFATDYVDPVVSNVTAVQVSGSTDVTLTYDLTDDTATNLTVELDVSDDSGSTWVVTDTSVTGSVGTGQATGVSKTITWDAGTDFPNQLQTDLRVQIRAKDAYQNQGTDVASSDFSLDTLPPATLVTADLQAQPNAGDTTVLIAGTFTETNPNTNDFYVAINGGAYSSATAGDGNTATPSTQLTGVDAMLDGNDYVSGVKIMHTDDFGQARDNENTSVTTAYAYVKPYTPQAPTLSNPVTTQLDVTINPHASEAGDLEYAINETTTGNFVQANGTLGASPVWQTMAVWGTKTITGLSSPVANYMFNVKSRNPNDLGDAISSESAYSATAQLTNTAPSISFGTMTQDTDGIGYVEVNYTGTDEQGDINRLTVYEYSTDNSNWHTMTEKSGVGSDGTTNLTFLPGGSVHVFAWDAVADLSTREDSTVYVRLRASDTLTTSSLTTSSAFEIDTMLPVVSGVSAVQNAGARTVQITYTLTDANNSLVELDISDDSGGSWGVTDGTVSGDVGSGVIPGSKTITWNAGADFNDQYQTDLQVRVRAKDTYGNQGDNSSSSDFVIDTKDPVVSNVTGAQDASLDTFAFQYDVSEDIGTVMIGLEISNDGGSSWSVPTTTAAGDLGAGITSGSGKTITWDAGTDYTGYEKSNMQIRVTATDSFTNAGNSTSSNFSLDTLAPRVTSVEASQTAGATNVSISYTLADQNTSLIELDISHDSGGTWSVTDVSVTGDVGSGVSAGSKTIIWDAGTDYNEFDELDMQVRVRAKDTFEHQSANTASSDYALDTLNPVADTVTDMQSQPLAGETTVLIGGSFTEAHPDTNIFSVALNGGAYSSGTAGDGNTANPSTQSTGADATLDGNDYISGVKITHTDDFGQTADNENTSPTVAYKYVKPYTPPAPTVYNPTVGTVDVIVNKHASETEGLEYEIYELTQAKYVQANGTLGDSAVWQTRGTGVEQWGDGTGTIGKITVSGLTNDSYTYQFVVYSRNTSDTSYTASSESAVSGSASSENQSPEIVIDSVAQTTDGTQYVTIDYIGSDLESESSTLIVAEYSTDNSNWYPMTEKAGVGSDGTTGLAFGAGGTVHDFMWDVGTDLSNTEDSTVYVRLRANDGTSNGSTTMSNAFVIDTKNPLTSSVTGVQVSDSGNVTVSYTLTDASESTVELDISDDAGSTWDVTDTSVTGDVGSGILSGSKSITWDALSDFPNQEQTDLRVQIKATDTFGNTGSYASSSNFVLDTYAPIVGSVSATQDAGLNSVTITYNLVDTNTSTIVIHISEDNGSTWGVATSTLSGDVGVGVTAGAGKTVSWDATTDFPHREESDLMVRVMATDTFANASGYVSSTAFTIDTLAPSISNVFAVQTAGTDDVVFTYDLSDSGVVTVTLDISDDSGSTWVVTDTSVTGSVGGGQTTGTGKTITWDAGTDAPDIDLSTMQVQVRGIDGFSNVSGNVSSSDFVLDTLDPAVATTADLQAQPDAGDTTALLGGSFTETHPDANTFYVELNDGTYTTGTVGDTNTATPSHQATDVEVTLDGNDYISAVKMVHADDYGHIVTNENTSPATEYVYVKPYTPQVPSVTNPQNTSVDVEIVPHASEVSGLEYAIYEGNTGSYVQADGTLDVGDMWRTTVAWGTVTVTGLTSPVAQYNFQVKSRNTSDASDALSSESNLSGVGSITNSSPTIAITSAAQVSATNYARIEYTGTDIQNDTNSLPTFEYSTDNSNWFSMTEKEGVGSDGTSDLLFTSDGASFEFDWDIVTDLPNTGDPTVYVRLQSSDTMASSNIATSSAFAIDTLGPVVSNIRTSQTAGMNMVTILYDLAETTVSGNTIAMTISDDSGATWDVPITTLVGDMGSGVSAGTDRHVTWDAGIDFGDQELSTMRVSIQGTDTYGNIGTIVESEDFTVDTKNPVVSGVTAVQTSGTTDVVVDYTLTDLSAGGITITLDISSDGGATWAVTDTSVTGNVGSGQTTGSKSFTWDAGTDFDGQFETGMQVRVRALDYFGNQGAFSESPSFTADTTGAVISNVGATQDVGAHTVTFVYDLADDTSTDLTTHLDISEDGGLSWTVTDTSIAGEIGSGQTTGLSKTVIWDAKADFNGQDVSTMRVRLQAIDHFGNTGASVTSGDFTLDTQNPVGPSNLTLLLRTDDSMTMTWTTAVDTHFDAYELWYGENQADVEGRTGTASEWGIAEDVDLDDILTDSTVVTGLGSEETLYIALWGADTFGNETQTNTVTVTLTPIEPATPSTLSGGVVLTPRCVGPGCEEVMEEELEDVTAPLPPRLRPVQRWINQTTIEVAGVAEQGTIINLYNHGNLVARLNQPTSGNGTFSQFFTFNAGEHALTAVAVDETGNTSSPSGLVVFTLDLDPPNPPQLLAPVQEQLSDSLPLFIGQTEPFALIELRFGDGFIASVNADASGVWFYQVPTEEAFALGEQAITLTATDRAQNESSERFVAFTIIEPPVLVPVSPIAILEGEETELIVVTPEIPGQEVIEELSESIELPGLSVPIISASVHRVEGERFAFQGTTFPNADVAVFLHSTQALVYQTQADAEGVWGIEHDQEELTLAPGDHSIYAIAVDPEARVKTKPGPIQVFSVEKNFWVELYGYLNLQTTLIVLGILIVVTLWLFSLKKRGVGHV